MKKLYLFSMIFILFSCFQKQKLNYYKNIIDGLMESKKTGKPIFLMFNMYGIGYDSFKYKIFSNRNVVKKLNENFVNIILMCDDRTKIKPEDTLGFSKFGLDTLFKLHFPEIITVGNLNAALEILLYDNRSQPHYSFLDSNRQLIIEQFGYKPDAKSFIEKVDAALKKLN